MKKILFVAAIAMLFVAVACESAPSTEVPAADSTACCVKDTTPLVKADSTVADTTKK